MASYVTAEELLEMYGAEGLTPETLALSIEQELIVPEGDRYRVPSPRLLHAGSEMVKAGIPLEVVLGLSAALARDMEASAARLIGAVNDHVVLKHPAVADASTDADVADLAAIIARLKPLAQLAVDAHLARAMERRVREMIQEHVEATGMTLDGPAASSA
jgi:hypothetical protein